VSTPHKSGHDRLDRFGPEGQRRRRRLAMVMAVLLALPLGGAGIVWAWSQLIG